NHYQSSLGMNEVQMTRKRKLKELNSFKILFNCSGCHITFGYDENDMWRDVMGHIELGYNKILPLLLSGYTVNRISKELNVHYLKVVEEIEYFSQKRLIPAEINENFIPRRQETDILNKFMDLDQQNGTMINNAMKTYGWTQKEYYYYFAMNDVQDFLLFNRERKTHQKDKWLLRIEEVLNTLAQQQERPITFREIAFELEISPSALSNYNINGLIEIYKSKQNEALYPKLCMDAALYIQKQQTKPGIKMGAFYKDFGKTEKWINLNFPQFKDWLAEQRLVHQQHYIEYQNEILNRKVIEIAEEIRAEGKRPNLEEIAFELGYRKRSMLQNPVIRKVLLEYSIL
ncbi:hypothetical protein MHB81_19430, partial [Paenibacillus sp. FSL H7-0326]